MSFMQPEVHESTYYSIETDDGTVIIPIFACGVVDTIDDLEIFLPAGFKDSGYHHDWFDHDDENSSPIRPEVESGWLYRLSAPGYMDSTDWGVCDTEKEAYSELLSMHGSYDFDESDWEYFASLKAQQCVVCGNRTSGEETCGYNCDRKLTERKGPQDGDITTSDHCDFYMDGELLFEVGIDDDYKAPLLAKLKDMEYFPNIWLISDHGNAHLLFISEE